MATPRRNQAPRCRGRAAGRGSLPLVAPEAARGRRHRRTCLPRPCPDLSFHLIAIGRGSAPADEPGLLEQRAAGARYPDDRQERGAAGVPSPPVLYWLRPDGHVGLCGAAARPGLVRDYLRARLGARALKQGRRSSSLARSRVRRRRASGRATAVIWVADTGHRRAELLGTGAGASVRSEAAIARAERCVKIPGLEVERVAAAADGRRPACATRCAAACGGCFFHGSSRAGSLSNWSCSSRPRFPGSRRCRSPLTAVRARGGRLQAAGYGVTCCIYTMGAGTDAVQTLMQASLLMLGVAFSCWLCRGAAGRGAITTVRTTATTTERHAWHECGRA